jgi:CheY-like chemotaxis protein
MTHLQRDKFYYDSLEIIENFLSLMARREVEIKLLYQQLEDYKKAAAMARKDPPPLRIGQAGINAPLAGCPTIVAAKNPAMRNRLTKILSFDSGCKVLAEAEEGGELLNKFLVHRPKLVVSDLELPTAEEGYRALKQIKTVDPDIVVIIISRDMGEDTLLKVMDIGAYDIISKPVNHLRLVTNIEKIREHLRTA